MKDNVDKKQAVSHSGSLICYASLLEMTRSDAIQFLATLEQTNQLKKWVSENCPQFLSADNTVTSFLLLESLEA
jgi:hypothetical protein